MLNEYSFEDIYIKHAVDDKPNDSSFTMHIHEQCEIYFFVSGNVEYLVEGSKYPLNENSLLIMRPAEAHKPKIIGTYKYERYAINFPLTFADKTDPKRRLMEAFTKRPLGKNNMFTASELDMTLVKKLFEQICSENSSYGRQLTVKTHLPMLLDMISRSFSADKNAEKLPQSTAEHILAYVNAHLADELSIPVLAKRFYLSTSQFSRVFKQATGAAPWEYITKKRLTAAKEMLRNGNSAQYVSENCGFGDYSAFYRAYAKYFGCTPIEDIGTKKS